jgi:hypothetical protein
MAAVAPPGEKTTEMEAVEPPTDGKTVEMEAVEPPADEPPADEVQVLEADEPPDELATSGELRAALHPRAASIKPPMPDPHLGEDEDDEPMISIEEGAADDGKGPRMVPIRRRVKSDPPELKARAGEVSLDHRPERSVDDQPAIIIDDDTLVPVEPVAGELRGITHRDEVPIPASTIEVDDTNIGMVLTELDGEESEPVLLEHRRTTETPVATARAQSSDDGLDATDEEIVVLEARKKPPATRAEKRTQYGVGAHAARTRHVPDPDDDEPTGVDRRLAPSRDEDGTDETLAAPPADPDRTDPHFSPPPPVILRPRASSIRPVSVPPPRAATLDDDQDDDEDEVPAGPATSEMSAVELDDVIPERRADVIPAHLELRRIDPDPLDDGWGPPGTTIPPPLLGALPGIDEDAETEDGSRIPVSNVNTAPLIVAPPSPPEPARGSPARADASGPTLVRALEDATSRAIQLISALERARDRDAVVTLMIGHLAESHGRAGFLMVRPSTEAGKAGELAAFRLEPPSPILPAGSLRLDRPSTLQDVVGTRLPYRGPMLDDASRAFLANVLGTCPPEILLVPVAVRERVVGVLFGEHRKRHTFDDQLALAARAAGMALERIMMAKRG